ncbi:MAG: hypothetical protein ACU0CO_13310 [Shimia sp.]
MTPDFALHLSFEGITLDQRTAAGWVTLGSVSFQSDSLAADIAALRVKGLAAASNGFRTKLVLPDDQVKYLVLRDGAPSRTSIGMALEGATPYALAELEYDWRVGDGVTRVAAVARETLAEAEAFASEHKFGPVAVVALPEDPGWEGCEAFFGPTVAGADHAPQRDPAPYRRADAAAAAAVPQPEPEALQDPDPEAHAETTQPPEPLQEPHDDLASPDADADFDPVAEDAVYTGTAPDAGYASLAASIPAEEYDDEDGFAGLAPGAARDPYEPQAEVEDGPPIDTRGPDAATLVAERAPVGSAPAIGGVGPASGAPVPAPAVSAPSAHARALEPLPPRRGPPTIPDPEAAAAAGGFFTSRRRQDVGLPPISAARTAPAAVAAAPVAPIRPQVPVTRPEAAPAQASGPAAAPVMAEGPSDGGRAPRVGGKPRFLGLILTAILLLLLAAVAAFAAAFGPETMARLFGRAPVQQVSVVAPAVVPPGAASMTVPETVAVLETLAAMPAPSGSTEEAAAPQVVAAPLPRSTAPLITPQEMRRTGPFSTFPAPEELADAEGEEALERGLAGPALTALPDDALAPAIVDGGVDGGLDGTGDLGTLAGLTPEAPDSPFSDPFTESEDIAISEDAAAAAPVARDDGPAARPLTEAEIRRRYAATGIWQLAPQAPRPQAPDLLDDVFLAAVDTPTSMGDAVALPTLAAIRTDERPATQALPPRADARFRVGPDGLVVPTPEGTPAPGGYTVYAGRPPVDLPLRVPEAAIAENPLLAYAAFRPQPRPGNFAERIERQLHQGYTRAELAAFKPQPRPAAPKEAQEAEVEDDAPPSPYAVATSPRPDARTAAFTRQVAAARAAAREAPRTAAVAPRAAARPSGPTRATVARAATTSDAINLRRINLIGVFGKPSSRNALVRLSNGRFVKVKVGGRLDGGRVAAIGESQLRYVKGGRNITLAIPST